MKNGKAETKTAKQKGICCRAIKGDEGETENKMKGESAKVNSPAVLVA